MLSEKPWNVEGFVRLLLGILFCVAVFILLEAALEYFLGKDKLADGTLPNLVLGSLSLHGSILLGTAVFLKWQHISWRDAFGFSTPPLARAILFGFVAALVFLPLSMVLQDISLRLLSLFHVPTSPQTAVAELEKANSPIVRAYLAGFAVLLAPLAEEILFRGIFYTAIKQVGLPRVALWGSSITFAVIHLSAAIFLPLVVLSLLLVWLYEKTDNLLAPITAHAVFNGINALFLFYGNDLMRFFNQHFSHGQ